MTIDATVAGANANSYVTIAEMDAWVNDYLTCAAATAWAALSDQNKSRYLIRACRELDRAHRWKGLRLTDMTGDTAQALEFPRVSLITRGGMNNIIGYDDGSYGLDERVRQAQMEQALFLVQTIAVEGDADPVGGTTRAKLQAEGVESIRIGNAAETYTGKARTLCDAAEALLKPLIRRSHTM